jgi:NAD-dependent dihydropyrimidine dehydrogenase PreA subunit
MSTSKGRIVIDEERCKGCGACFDDAQTCTGCTFCAIICPDVAIEVYKDTQKG